MKDFIINQVRVQILSQNVVRIEQARRGKFCDESTYFIPDRSVFEGCDATFSQNGGNCVISWNNYELIVPQGATGLADVKLFADDKLIYKYKRTPNCGELPAVEKTPQAFAVTDNPRIILPQKGYCSGARYSVTDNVCDVYLLLCNGDFKLLRRLYVDLTGKTEMVRLSTLGMWNSRYFEHSDASARELLLDYAKHGVPLDNMVIDTDWRKSSATGIGYEVNTELFPDIKDFFKFAHSHDVEIMFNDHPEPVEGAKSVFDRKEIKYREKNLKAHLKSGLDYWWYDRNWHTKLISPNKKINPESLGAYLFADITKQHFQSKGSEQVYRRPVIMCNVDNISNGTYKGVNDTASHRYSMQWTGDVGSNGAALAAEINNMLFAQNSCIAYVNADCGGHTGNPTKQEYIRWIQFGAFSPILRPHCTKDVERFREPWAYDDETLSIAREYVRMRYRLLPLLYKNAYQSYISGKPLFQPLSYLYPNDVKTHKIYDEYLMGDNILVAPLHDEQPKKVGLDNYCCEVQARYFNGTHFQGEPIAEATYRKVDMYCNGTSPEKNVPPYNFSAIFETRVKFNCDVELIVESDDGVTVEVDGVTTLEDKTFHGARKMKAGILTAGEIHSVKLYYFQGQGEAALSLFYNEAVSKCTLTKREFYLPEGSWIDVFDGTEYKGGRKYAKSYEYNAMPLFVKKGGVIPLVECKQTTKQLDWSTLTFDMYPSKTESVCDFLYEDDKETTAYKQGEWRLSEYQTSYNAAKNAICLTLQPSNGEYNDGITTRNVTVKYHLLKDVKNVCKVLVNGVETKFETVKKSNVYPFTTDKSACDNNVIIVDFKHSLFEQTVVEFILK